MAVSKANQRAVNKYVKNNYDRINVTMPKGKKDTIQAHAEAHSESVNGFINRAIDQVMERDTSGAAVPEPVQDETGKAPAGRVVYRVPAGIASEIAQQAAERPSGAGVVSLPSETLEAAQRAAEAAGEALPDFVTRAVETQAKRDQSSLRLGINPATGGKLEGKE